MTSFIEVHQDGQLQALQNCSAPAKLNLFLHVTGRQPDGYHLLQSVFQLIDWSDTLDFAVRGDGAIMRTSDLHGVPADADLCVRAARLLQEASGCPLGVDITIRKMLPMGGGIGGGSSDAATTLLALNRLWHLDWPREKLMALGLRLGADVPFFVFGRNAWAAGIGEQLEVIELPIRWFAVLVPPVEVPTATIFSDTRLTRDTAAYTIADFLEQPDPFAFGHNDLQDVATRKYAEVEQALQWLKKFNPHARMTGSGACVFASFASEEAARQALRDLPQGMRGQLVKGLTGHPMLGFA